MYQKRGALGMGMIISILLHALLLLYLPIDWLREVELRVYILDQYGPVQASIMEELPPEQLKAQTPPKTAVSSQPATQVAKKVEPSPPPKTEPKVEPEPVTPPKMEPKVPATTSTSPNVQKVDETPKAPEPSPKPSVVSPANDDEQNDVIDKTSQVEDKNETDIITTSNPDSSVEITVPSSQKATSAPSVQTSSEPSEDLSEPSLPLDSSDDEGALDNQEPGAPNPPVVVDEPIELRIPGNQLVIGRIEPTYPKYAQSEESEGAVALEILVKPDGSIEEVKIVSTSGDLRLDEAARRIISDEWQFSREYEKGYTVPVTVDFRLGSHVGKVKIGEVVIQLD